jgi:hypothetical protein
MLEGGCLCGAVRWTAEGAAKAVHHCHCSMCRRWTGSSFATLAWFARDAVRWTGTPAAYRSSPIAVRTHCGRCGTPLSLAYDSRNDLALAVGSFDAPEAVTPTHHYGVESRIRWADMSDLPDKAARERWSVQHARRMALHGKTAASAQEGCW